MNKEQTEIYQQIRNLRQEHQELDDKIHHLTTERTVELLLVSNLKKQKLQIKEKITQLQAQLPNDIA